MCKYEMSHPLDDLSSLNNCINCEITNKNIFPGI